MSPNMVVVVVVVVVVVLLFFDLEKKFVFLVCLRQKLLHLISKKRNIALLLAFCIHGLAHRSL